MKKLLLVLVAIILLVEGSVLAGPIVLEQVSGSASWVVHANPAGLYERSWSIWGSRKV